MVGIASSGTARKRAVPGAYLSTCRLGCTSGASAPLVLRGGVRTGALHSAAALACGGSISASPFFLSEPNPLRWASSRGCGCGRAPFRSRAYARRLHIRFPVLPFRAEPASLGFVSGIRMRARSIPQPRIRAPAPYPLPRSSFPKTNPRIFFGEERQRRERAFPLAGEANDTELAATWRTRAIHGAQSPPVEKVFRQAPPGRLTRRGPAARAPTRDARRSIAPETPRCAPPHGGGPSPHPPYSRSSPDTGSCRRT